VAVRCLTCRTVDPRLKPRDVADAISRELMLCGISPRGNRVMLRSMPLVTVLLLFGLLFFVLRDGNRRVRVSFNGPFVHVAISVEKGVN